jgi:hypothetical protein
MFIPPPLSAACLSQIDFSKATPIAEACKALFDAYDAGAGNRDPSRCKAILQLRIAWGLGIGESAAASASGASAQAVVASNAGTASVNPATATPSAQAATASNTGTPSVNPQSLPRLRDNPQSAVFWSSKLAIDADGKAEDAQHLSGTQLDPADGQNDTSFHFLDGTALSSERHPFIVLPGGEFRSLTGLKLGDLAAVVYRNRITAAICGDIGPVHKIGEASIRVHEAFIPDAPDPCHRNPDGSCRLIHDVSIDQDVLIFAFPGSALGPGLNPDNAEVQIKARVYALFAQLHTPS